MHYKLYSSDDYETETTAANVAQHPVSVAYDSASRRAICEMLEALYGLSEKQVRRSGMTMDHTEGLTPAQRRRDREAYDRDVMVHQALRTALLCAGGHPDAS